MGAIQAETRATEFAVSSEKTATQHAVAAETSAAATVEAAPRATATAETARAESIIRPIRSGAVISSVYAFESASTLGCFVVDDNGQIFLISAVHGIVGTEETAVIQPSLIDHGQAPQDIIGYIAHTFPHFLPGPATQMTVLIRLASGLDIKNVVPQNTVNIKNVTGIRDPEPGMVVYKVNQAALTEGVIEEVDLEVNVPVASAGNRVVSGTFINNMVAFALHDLISLKKLKNAAPEPELDEVSVRDAALVTLPFNPEVDSGAMVIDEGGHAVGILIGTTTYEDEVYAVLAAMQDIIDKYNEFGFNLNLYIDE